MWGWSPPICCDSSAVMLCLMQEIQIQSMFLFDFFFPWNYNRLKTHCNRNNQHVNIVPVEQKSKTGICRLCRFQTSSGFDRSEKLWLNSVCFNNTGNERKCRTIPHPVADRHRNVTLFRERPTGNQLERQHTKTFRLTDAISAHERTSAKQTSQICTLG